MKLLTYELNGIKVQGYAQKIKNKLWFYKDGQTFVIEDESNSLQGRKSRKKSEGKASADHIQSPMPGKITKIMASLHAQVKVGQPLLVMEAMKMEYTLKSEIEGSVEKINVTLGQQVALGELLIQLKEGKKEKGI